MALILISVAVGALAGVLAALCGVGGGLVMVPAFILALRMEAKTAIATSLAVIIVTAIAATVRNAGNQLVDWKVMAATGTASAVVAWFASDWLKKLSNVSLTRIFAVAVVIMGIYMLIRSFGAQSEKPVSLPSAAAESSK